LEPEGQNPQTGTDDHLKCIEFLRILQAALLSCPHIRIADWIDLNQVVRSLRKKDYECDVTQRFAAYRSVGQHLLGNEAALVEKQLETDRVFCTEIEGTGCAYLEIFQNLASRVETMKVFEARLRELGITAPEAFKRKIGERFYGSNKIQDQETD
jgi:hypothetical protein